MNDPTQPAGEPDGLDEQLVPYLDGELSANEAGRVEEALAHDPRVRRELWQLERSWQLLDDLPRSEVDESFTRSTVEMIAVKAEEDLAAVQTQIPRRKRRAWVAVVAAAFTAAVAGYLATTLYTRRTDEQLLRDLPVIENFDQYREIDDLEFLRSLEERGFGAEGSKHDR